MIDWNRDGRVDPSEVAFTLFMLEQEAEQAETDESSEETGQPPFQWPGFKAGKE